MAFTITQVGYRDFRSLGEFVLEPGPRLTILVGPNAAGKTNCVEGIQLLTAGVSFRHASPSELVRRGAETAALRLHAEGDKRMLDIGYDIFPSKKLLSVNGKRRRNSEGRGILPSILFYPDELLVVKGGAAGRRELFDDFGVQLNKGYARVASDYRRALMQRNSLLKDIARDGGVPLARSMLEAWTESLVNAGSVLCSYRAALVRRLAPHVGRAYANLAGGERVAMAYRCAYWVPATWTEGQPARADIQQGMRAKLAELHDDELRRCQTLAGPHLDDVEFEIEGMPARTYGSQGQQRSLVLAIKLAQVELVREMQGQYPVFLLDDVMSELDTGRRSRLFDLIQSGMQTLVTTTNLEYFRAEELDQATVVRLGRSG